LLDLNRKPEFGDPWLLGGMIPRRNRCYDGAVPHARRERERCALAPFIAIRKTSNPKHGGTGDRPAGYPVTYSTPKTSGYIRLM